MLWVVSPPGPRALLRGDRPAAPRRASRRPRRSRGPPTSSPSSARSASTTRDATVPARDRHRPRRSATEAPRLRALRRLPRARARADAAGPRARDAVDGARRRVPRRPRGGPAPLRHRRPLRGHHGSGGTPRRGRARRFGRPLPARRRRGEPARAPRAPARRRHPRRQLALPLRPLRRQRVLPALDVPRPAEGAGGRAGSRASWPRSATLPSAPDFDHPLDYRPVDGEHDVFGDGTVVLIPTYGHTPGHQSLRVRAGKGADLVLTADACYTRENMDRDLLPGVLWDADEMARSLARLRDAPRPPGRHRHLRPRPGSVAGAAPRAGAARGRLT